MKQPKQTDGLGLPERTVTIDPEEEGILTIPVETRFYKMYETGGGYSRTGGAVIIATVGGKPWKPFRIYRKGSLACATHAEFSIPVKYPCAEISCDRDGDITIEIVSFARNTMDPEHLVKISEEVFRGYFEDLPKRLIRFLPAIQAGLAKSACYHCREPHFVRLE